MASETVTNEDLHKQSIDKLRQFIHKTIINYRVDTDILIKGICICEHAYEFANNVDFVNGYLGWFHAHKDELPWDHWVDKSIVPKYNEQDRKFIERLPYILSHIPRELKNKGQLTSKEKTRALDKLKTTLLMESNPAVEYTIPKSIDKDKLDELFIKYAKYADELLKRNMFL